MWFWILLIAVLLVAYWYLSVPSKLPPGPYGLPLLGSLPFLSAHLHRSFAKLGQKYGSIFHVYMGSRLIIVLNNYKAAKEALVKQADTFIGRPHDIMFRESVEENHGLAANDNEFWKQNRRFVLTNLRDHGVGKLALEPRLLNEIDHFIKEVKKSNGKPVNIKQLLQYSLANNVHILLTGNRYDYDHPMPQTLQKIFDKFVSLATSTSMQMFFPWLLKVPGGNLILRHNEIRVTIMKLVKIMTDVVQKNKLSQREGDSGTYIFDYLNEKKRRSETIANDEIFTEEGLAHISRDLLAAGTETSATTLLWLMLYLTNYPEVQKKVQKEIDEVIGHERDPSYNDRANMPYTEATLCEISRIVTITPLGLPHRNTKETTLFGHTIPQSTTVFINLWNIHHDPELWGDPENFRPERFINDENKLSKPEYLVPFSLGKRACVGEPLARMELFLYFVSLLQHFEFVPPNGVQPSLETKPGFSTQPLSSIVCAKLRTFAKPHAA